MRTILEPKSKQTHNSAQVWLILWFCWGLCGVITIHFQWHIMWIPRVDWDLSELRACSINYNLQKDQELYWWNCVFTFPCNLILRICLKCLEHRHYEISHSTYAFDLSKVKIFIMISPIVGLVLKFSLYFERLLNLFHDNLVVCQIIRLIQYC